MRPAWLRVPVIRLGDEGNTDEEDDFLNNKSIFYDPSRLLKTILVGLGIIWIGQNVFRYLTSLYSDTSSTAHVTTTAQHPLDLAFSHHKNNSGVGAHGTKSIVVASMSYEDTTWIQDYLPDWENNIYVVDDRKANLTVFINHGHEAAVYLSYIINHYYVLPDYVAFLHAKRYQWHNEDPMFDGVMPMKHLRLEHVKEVGYASLRCTWHPGCPSELLPTPNATDTFFGMLGSYTSAFTSLFPELPLPSVVGTPCCAQFVVTRSTIQSVPIWRYESLRQWLWETSLPDSKSGRVMEYLWHVLFGQEAVACPSTQSCFCEKFGVCGLSCSSEGYCEGRWLQTPYLAKMPEGWPMRGQGTDGYPRYGWWKQWYPEEEWGLEYIRDNMVNETEEAVGGSGNGEVEAGADMSEEEAKEEGELADAATFGGAEAVKEELEAQKGENKNEEAGKNSGHTDSDTAS